LFNVFHVNYLKENTIFVAKKKRQHKKKIFFTRFRRSYPSDEGAQNIYYYNNKLLQMMIDIEYVYVPPEWHPLPNATGLRQFLVAFQMSLS